MSDIEQGARTPRRARASWLAIAALSAAATAASAAPAADTTLTDLPIGDPARRERTAPLALDAAVDTRTGEVIGSAELVRRLAETRILFIGEEHTDSEFHAVQLRVIRALTEAGRAVRLGVEMFPYTVQGPLEDWTHDLLTEEGFLEKSDWYRNWGFNFGYYRAIFDYARTHRLPIVGLNLPDAALHTIRTAGFDALDPAARSHLPPRIDLASAEHQRLYRAYFGPDDALHAGGSVRDQAARYRVQVAWDAAMGWGAAQAIAGDPDPAALIVVLIGSGHVAYGLGAPHQLAGQYPGKVSTLLPVPVRDAGFAPVTGVRASYADFVWGVPPQLRPDIPSLGVALAGRLGGGEPNQVMAVDPGSPAALAGVAAGDVLLQLDAVPLATPGTLPRLLGAHRWGDEARLELRRGERTLDLPLVLRTVPDDLR
jgi:uncharacterized iron-regulated protein